MYLEQDQPEFQVEPAPETLGLSFLMYKESILTIYHSFRVCVCAYTHIHVLHDAHIHMYVCMHMNMCVRMHLPEYYYYYIVPSTVPITL